MNIIITGASAGIGYQTAIAFAKEPGHNIFAISRDAARLRTLCKESTQLNSSSNIIGIPMDIANSAGFQILKEKLSEHIDHIDVLINNAGSLVNKRFTEISELELKAIYSVNVFAPFLLIQNLLPYLRKSQRAQIINIGSMGGITGTAKFAGLSAYSSSKGALAILTECLAEELKEEGIRVNCLALGAVNTEMLQNAFPGYKASHNPVEMADFIRYFAIQGAVFFNGKTLPVSSSTP